MKKTLIALALTALPVAAMADVTLYGTIKGGVEYTKVKSAGNSITNLNDWDSVLGFKGSEDLGNGLKAIWQIEQGVSIDSRSGRNQQFASRDSFIGLSSPFGTLRAGYLSNQFNSDMDTVDQWSGNGINTLGYSFGRYSNRYTAVRYDSPDFAGFNFNLLYSPEDNVRYDDIRRQADTDPDIANILNNINGLQDAVGIINGATIGSSVAGVGLNYENSGFFAKYGFLMTKYSAGRKDGQVHRVEVGYDANNLFVGLGYQFDRYGVNGLKAYHEVAASAAYTAGNVTPKLTYAHGFKKGAIGAYDQAILGVDYNLSKRTTAMFSVAWVRDYNSAQGIAVGNKRTVYSSGLGLSHKF